MRIPKRKSEQDRLLLQGDEPIYLTKSGIEKLKRTIDAIKRDIPAIREELIATREMGDLSENAGYQIAKSKLRSMQSRLFTLEERLKHVVEIDQSSGSKTAQIGTTVKIALDSGTFTYEIVGSLESSPQQGRISYTSPLGSALIGKAQNDSFIYQINGENYTGKLLEIS